MPAQQPQNDLLIKYLLHEANTEEETFVAEWIAASPQNRHYFQAFEKVWLLTRFTDATNAIDVDAEWAIFKNSIAKTDAESLPAGKRLSYPLYGQPAIPKSRKTFKIFTAIAVAASIVAAVFIGNFLFVQQANKSSGIVATSQPKDSVAFVLRHEINTTGKPKKLLLQDGTAIILEDKSELSFTEPFAATYRSITLQGKANFKVAKDKNRPFTVFSDAIATTVLGTVFDVSAYPQEATISVRLYEGKVVMNPAVSGSKKLQQAVYLLPGYEMVYNKQTALASIRSFGSAHAATTTGPASPLPIDNPNIPGKKGSWYMFNNQPLSQVFDQLKEMYKADIQYRKKDVQKLYFIGQFNKEDSLETVLSQIALSNNLLVTKSNNTFVITTK